MDDVSFTFNSTKSIEYSILHKRKRENQQYEGHSRHLAFLQFFTSFTFAYELLRSKCNGAMEGPVSNTLWTILRDGSTERRPNPRVTHPRHYPPAVEGSSSYRTQRLLQRRGCCLRLIKLHEGVLTRLIQVFTAVVKELIKRL